MAATNKTLVPDIAPYVPEGLVILAKLIRKKDHSSVLL